MKNGLSLFVLVFALGGCTIFGQNSDTPAVVYYVLNDTGPRASPTPTPADARTLLVLDTATGGFYDTDQLAFSRSAGTRGQYQFARWTERPGKRFADLLRARLDRLGRYRVAGAGSYLRGDLMLDTRLIDFYHDAATRPGQVRLELRAELVDLKRRALLGRRTFEQRVPVATYDAAGAAQASSQAVSRVLDDLSAWLASVQEAPRIQTAAPTTKGERP
ncbi:MAG: ABC-type transport auxiliary lipoprotein family protein [Thiobacillus sp.]